MTSTIFVWGILEKSDGRTEGRPLRGPFEGPVLLSGYEPPLGCREIQLPERALYAQSLNGREPPHGVFEAAPGSVYTLRTSTQGSGGFEARNFHLARSTVVYRDGEVTGILTRYSASFTLYTKSEWEVKGDRSVHRG